ncbi:hypothetical protein [Bacillus halotolerans]|uniref:Uncharacterized protein n=1 Tax=Bacillus halotolerans TaxID=260554 RepID=A0A9Q6F253_9BACI|nr:hypothetical protein [Bacillus halotolerans]PLS07681.1 hypothetical protein CUU63_10360 [Bacillus halotolerans]
MKATIEGVVYEGTPEEHYKLHILMNRRVESVSINTTVKNSKGLDFADKLAANTMYHSKQDWR